MTHIQSSSSPAPAATDHVEQRAAEIAKREGRNQVTHEDRNRAMEELQETAPPAPPDEPTSH